MYPLSKAGSVGLRLLKFALISTALFASGAVAAPPDLVPPGFPDIQLPAKARGEEAISRLGAKLPAMAAFYRTTESNLRERLRRDKSLWVDTKGRLFYVCEWGFQPDQAASGQGESIVAAAPFAYNKTFSLHSRPGATRVVYLDFDGHDASATSWGADAIGVAFDLDGDSTTFSTSERDAIQFIWQRVAEDYAMYDIDVTTEDPGVEGLRKLNASDVNYGIRVVIGGTSTDWYNLAGGVAYVGSFDWNSDTPCWVWPGSLGKSEKNIAEAASHEVGHTLGLSHDGKTDGTEYYGGQGNWAPIMGVGYSKPITHWSKGEYTGANNLEDDLAVMLGEGVSYRVDDYGNTIATASPLPGVTPTVTGNIERNTDVDFFSFQIGGGRVILTATPAPRGANLHILLSLYNSAGTLLLSTNAADTTAGVQPVTISTVLPGGTYYVSIDGIGVGDPATTGYSEYASLGEYTLTGSLPSDSAWIPTPAGVSYSWTNGANWASNTIPNTAGATARINNNIVGDQTLSLNLPVTIGQLFIGDVNASHSFTLQDGPGGSLAFSTTSANAILNKSAGTNDIISATIALQSDLTVLNTTTSSLTFSGLLSGSRGLLKTGSGKLLLAGTAAYTGSTVVGGGTFALLEGSSIAGTPVIDVRAGAVLDVTSLSAGLVLGANQLLSGNGQISGNVTVPTGAQLAPGTNGVPGTMVLNGDLALNNGAKLNFDLGSTTAPGGGINDLITVNGNLNLSGTVVVDFNFLNNLPASVATYTLITYSGALTGGAANLTPVNYTNRYLLTFDDSVPGEIRLQVSGAPGNLVWSGDSAVNRWDLSAAPNWLDAGSPATFAQLDSVTFDDAGSAAPFINLLGALKPATVTVTGSKSYTFAGSGKLSGAASIIKQGSGTLTVNTTNDYSGSTLLNAGMLKVGNAQALGNASGGLTIAAGATLDLNAFNLGAEQSTIQGAGIGGNGAIISSSGVAQSNALRFVTLAGDTTLGGAGRWDIRANPTAVFLGNNFNLTKTNANEIWLVDVGSTGLGDITINQGALGIQGTTTLGDATKTLTLATNTAVAFLNTDNNVLNKKLVVNGGTIRNDAGDNIFSGGVTVNGAATFTGTAMLTVQGSIGGTGNLVKTGTGTLALSTSNSYAGTTTISAGTIKVANAFALGSTNSGTTIATGAKMDLNGFTLGAEPISVLGTGMGNAGAIINTGPAQQNALRFVTLTGNTTFGGINRWDVRANPTATFTGNNFALTKSGVNEVWLVDVGASGLANITISEGILGVQGNSTLGGTAQTLTINSAGSLGIWATGTNVLNKVLAMSGGRVYNGSGSNALFGTAGTLSSSNSFDIASGTTLLTSNALSGSGSLNKLSAGTLIVTANNTYSGYTAARAGTLQFGNDSATGSPGTGSITNNATLIFFRSNALTVASQISGTGALYQNGSGTLTLSGNNTYNGLTTLNTGTLAVGSDTALGSGSLDLRGGTFQSANASLRTLTNSLIVSASVVLGAAGTGDLVFNGNGVNFGSIAKTLTISNANVTLNNSITNALATITKNGPGTLALGGNNIHLSSTVVNLGTLKIDAQSRLGLNPVAFNAGQLTLDGGALQTSTTFAINDSNRGITLGSLGGTFTPDPGTILTISNIITGAGSLKKAGSGNLILSAVNTYIGDTIINTGVLSVGNANAIPKGAGKGNVVVTGILDLNGKTVSINGLSGSGIVNSSTLAANLIVGANNDTSLFSGTIQDSVGTLSLVKSGSGILTLTKSNPYTKTTTITGGTLALSGAGAIPNSSVIRIDAGANLNVTGVLGNFALGSSQTLIGNGTVTGNLIANGTLSPGLSSMGQLNFDTLTLAGTASMEITRTGSSPTNDSLVVGGTLTYGGQLVVTNLGSPLIAGDSFRLFSASTYSGNFASTSLPSLNAGLRWNTAQLQTSGTLQVVPMTPPQILPLTLSGTNLLISTQSDPGMTYVLQSAAGLDAPVNWTSIATNSGTGNVLTFTVPVDSQPRKFFQLIAY